MDPLTPQLHQGLAHHRQGNLAAAEACYRATLAEQPGHAKGWWLLGMLQHQRHELEPATASLERAVELGPTHPPFHLHLGNVLLDRQELSRAADHFRRVLALDPHSETAQRQLGRTLLAQGEISAAVTALQSAVAHAPADATAWGHLASALTRQGDLAAAKQAYAQLTALQPSCAASWSNAGGVLLELGESAAAIEHFRHATTCGGDRFETWTNLGIALSLDRQYTAAAVAFEQACELQPEAREPWERLAEATANLGQVPSARTLYQRAAQFAPRSLVAVLRPLLVMPRVFESNAAIDDFRRTLATQLAKLPSESFTCDWEHESLVGAMPPAELMYQGRDDRPLKEAIARLFEAVAPQCPLAPPQGVPRVGFVVTRGHEGIFLRGMKGVLSRWNFALQQVTIFAPPSGLTKLRAALPQVGIRWCPLPSSLPDMLATIRRSGCDLMYFWEVGSDWPSYFLPLLRVAPVQVASWGWPVTSGLRNLDVFVSSRRLEPPGAQSHYTERLIQLDEIPNCYDLPDVAAIGPDRARFGFAAHEHVYLCPQNPLKLHPDFDAVAADLLEQDPLGRLALLESSRSEVTAALQARLAANLGTLARRVQWIPRMTSQDYLRMLVSADVLLDSLHYTGGANSVYDALAFGLPIVTLPGPFHRGRYTAACYEQLGVVDTVASDAADYVRRAVQLANEPDQRRSIQRQISERRGELLGRSQGVVEIQNCFAELIQASRDENRARN